MKNRKMKRVIIAAFFLGTLSYVSAQTEVKADTTVALTQQSNPTIEGLKQKIQANPNDTESIVRLAEAYQEAQDWNGALEAWAKVNTLLPDWAPVYYSQGYVYQNLKDTENAKSSYEKFISKVKPEEIEVNKKNLAYAHFFVAYALFENDKNAAKEHIAKSLQYDPANKDAQELLKSLNG